jgi:hypothetical protein
MMSGFDPRFMAQLLGARGGAAASLPTGSVGASASNYVDRHGLPPAPPPDAQSAMFVPGEKHRKNGDGAETVGRVRYGR